MTDQQRGDCLGAAGNRVLHTPNLDRDPCELQDLAGDTGHEAELRKWRQRLIDHFAERGEPFLVNGKLGLRPKSMLTGPNFPGKS